MLEFQKVQNYHMQEKLVMQYMHCDTVAFCCYHTIVFSVTKEISFTESLISFTSCPLSHGIFMMLTSSCHHLLK